MGHGAWFSGDRLGVGRAPRASAAAPASFRPVSFRPTRVAVTLAALAALAATACTTYIQPVRCEGGPFECNEHNDVHFCEYVAVEVQGAECEKVGLRPAQHFCVATPAACVDTTYELEDRGCKVARYQAVRQWRECSTGSPTFITASLGP